MFRVEHATHHLGIDQCMQIFVAVGITSDISHHVLNLSRSALAHLSAHPRAHDKLCIMRSGGPFDDATWGIRCVAVDKFLSVQAQVPGAGAGGPASGTRYVPDKQQGRERRSFAPSPPGASARIASSACEGERSPSGALDVANTPSADARISHDDTSPSVITKFDPTAIEQTHGRPLCAKYHLSHGTCHCDASQRAQRLHESVILEPGASKQLAVWASSSVCPDGPSCPDAAKRTCCYWFHEPGLGKREEVADEWISVDKKGKPIVTSASRFLARERSRY